MAIYGSLHSLLNLLWGHHDTHSTFLLKVLGVDGVQGMTSHIFKGSTQLELRVDLLIGYVAHKERDAGDPLVGMPSHTAGSR